MAAAANPADDPGKLATIDFEASCFPSRGRSFPIEAGLCRVADGFTASWLIRPTAEWLTWDWDPGAEATHGISLDEALRRGRPVDEVVREMAAFTAGLTVLCDSGLDAVWLEALVFAARRGAPFRVFPVDPVLKSLTLAADDLDDARRRAALQFPHLHRAGPDARHLAEVIRILSGYDANGI